MPRALLWTPLAIGFSNKDASILLETIKPSKVTKSELVPCTVCTVAEPHNMRYRLRRCSCRSCTEEAPYAKCPWRAKTLHCEKVDHVDIYETSKHVTAMRTAPEPRLTSEMKVVAREMTAQGLKPVRIRNAILRKFNLAAEELPALSKIQRFCQHYASTKLGCNDYVKETHDLIRDAGYVSTMDEHESFTFALNSDATGLPVVGIGSGTKPFIVGVTSRRLLTQADREAGSLLLHVDATFKLNQVGYPSIVVGFSDCARGFLLLALFVSSQR
ncbi:hypothetical protein PHYSODRAFT_371190, partial [Phytophthora sojae]